MENRNVSAAEHERNGGADAQKRGGFTPFAAFGGGSLRAESGSHVDTKGFGSTLGFARELSNTQGHLLFGPVVKYGGGSYDSYLGNGVHGEGGSHWGIPVTIDLGVTGWFGKQRGVTAGLQAMWSL